MNFFKKQYSTEWVEESFIFETSQGRQIGAPPTTGYIGSSFTARKAFIFIAVIFVIFLLFIGKIFFLQMVHGKEYRDMAQNNRERTLPVMAERGIIYDRNKIPLTKNIPNFSLAIVPQDLPRELDERNKIISKLASITGEGEENIRQFIEEYKSYRYESIVVEDDISYDMALRIIIESSDLPGIVVQQGSKRLYLDNATSTAGLAMSSVGAFSHILGYVGKMNIDELDTLRKNGYTPSDSIGKTGVEKIYETELRGVFGKKRIEVNAIGKEQSVLSQTDPTPGNHILLSIDSNMQLALSQILAKNLQAARKDRGSAVVMDPRSGEILAMVSIPTFNNNDFSGGIDKQTYDKYTKDPNHPLFFRAIGGTYPSGSSVKPAIGAAALEEGIITQATTFLSTGGLRVGAWLFPDWNLSGHGITDIRKSLAWSVNTFYYYIGGGYGQFKGLGIDRLRAYLEKFGFGKKLGIDLPGESAGFVPWPEWKKEKLDEQWYIGDTYNLSIGQGYFLVTPLQIASMTSVVANGGTLYRPHVLHSIINPVSKEITEQKAEVLDSGFVSNKNLQIVRLGMRDCVTVGSCHRLAGLPVAAAGKTGTAQWNKNMLTHAWFTSFAPFDKPEIVVTVMVEEGGEGGIIGTPIAEEFYRWWWGYKH